MLELKRIKIIRKVVLLGDLSVGKTSLIRRYVLDEFSDDYISTIGTKVTNKKILYELPDENLEIELILMIWDIMGQRENDAIPRHFEGSKGAIMVSDLTRKNTLHNLQFLTNKMIKIDYKIPMVFVANKNDLKDDIQFTIDELKDTSDMYQAPAFSTSAKTGDNVEKIFFKLGESMLRRQGVRI